jgi:putative addiction module killer protein
LRQIVQSATFERWISGLRDRQAKARILVRIDRLAGGNPGDVRPIGSGVSELRINCGPGYRVYFIQEGVVLVVILCGGDKRTQAGDIKRALGLAVQWREQEHGKV